MRQLTAEQFDQISHALKPIYASIDLHSSRQIKNFLNRSCKGPFYISRVRLKSCSRKIKLAIEKDNIKKKDVRRLKISIIYFSNDYDLSIFKIKHPEIKYYE